MAEKQEAILVRFTTDSEKELYEYLREKSYKTKIPMAELVRAMIQKDMEANSMTKYRGLVIDELKSMETEKTKWYDTYKEAHDAAEKLCKKAMGDRGRIDVEEK